MAKNKNQKLKGLYLLKILAEHTDEEHKMSMNEIISALAIHGISAERKSVYEDIEGLTLAGYDVIYERGKNGGYYLAARDFELAELKLLVDSVQASRFITEKKTNELISKLEKLTSKPLAQQLQRQVYVTGRVKGLNERIFYTTDAIHEALVAGKKIRFKYFDYTTSLEKAYRNNGEFYTVSPFSLSVSDEKYYLICYYPENKNNLTHFRVDRMSDVEIMEEDAEKIDEIMGKSFNLGDYSRKVFSMYSGKTEFVKLVCTNDMVNQIVDRFGDEVIIKPCDDGHFSIGVNVDVSPTFFAWVFTYAGKIRIQSPSSVKAEFDKMISCFD